MAIAFRSSSVVTFSSDNPSVPLPAGHTAGDLLLCHLQFSAGVAPTPPAGWTEITAFEGDAPQSGYRLYWKIDSGSETDPAVWVSTASGGATMLAYSGVDATVPIEMAAAGIITGSGGVDYPAVVSRSDNAVAVATYTRINTTTATTFAAPPSPFTSRQIGAGTLIAGSSYYTSVASDAPVTPHWTVVNAGSHGAVVSSNRTVFIVVLRASGETDYGTQARVSQVVTEALVVGTPQTRVSQLVVEALRANVVETNDDVGIDYVAAGAVTTSGVGGSLGSVDMPAGIVAGDFLLLLITSNVDGRTWTVDGWAQLPGTPIATTTPDVLVGFYKIATGSDGSVSPTYSGSQGNTGSAVVHAWRGVDNVSPFAVTPESVFDSENAPAYRIGLSQISPVDEVLAVFAAVTRQTTDPADPISFDSPWTERAGTWHTTTHVGVSVAERGYSTFAGFSAGHVRYTQAQLFGLAVEALMLLQPGSAPPPPSASRPYVVMVGD